MRVEEHILKLTLDTDVILKMATIFIERGMISNIKVMASPIDVNRATPLCSSKLLHNSNPLSRVFAKIYAFTLPTLT